MDELSGVTLRGPTTVPGLAVATEPGTLALADDLNPSTLPAATVAATSPELTANGEPAVSRSGNRASVIQLAIREKAALYAAYMPFLEGGGLFVPTTRVASLGDELYLILSLVDDPNKLSVTGKVVWMTPASATGRQQGIGVQFTGDEAGLQARTRIENLLGGALKANRSTHTL